jgi:alpha-1,3/alpha-1,6-mannosyltransferase
VEDRIDDDYLAELEKLGDDLKLQTRLIFLQGISNNDRTILLERSNVVLYTPVNEIGIGILPIEAMALGCIVIACNSGGQLESINHEYNGFLLPPLPSMWGEKIFRIL